MVEVDILRGHFSFLKKAVMFLSHQLQSLLVRNEIKLKVRRDRGKKLPMAKGLITDGAKRKFNIWCVCGILVEVVARQTSLIQNICMFKRNCLL